MDKKKIINIIVVVAIIAALFFGLTILVGTPEERGVLTTGTGRPPVVEEIIGILQNLSTLTIDATIFEDPSYRTLDDFSVTITPQSQGKRNPFAEFRTTGI